MESIYIVNYKETITDGDNIMATDCGIFDSVFKIRNNAIKFLRKIAKEKKNDIMTDDEDVIENREGKDYICLINNTDTYEYYITKCSVSD